MELQRLAMVAEIKSEARSTASYTDRPQLGARVLDAMAKVERHQFVPSSRIQQAYANMALPIQCNQTISQPFIVALMTDLLDLAENAIVLEIGAGSGYQTAILAEIVKKVYTIELVDKLALTAQSHLQEMGYTNIKVIVGDGYHGCPEHAPFDGIIITAAIAEVPQPLIDQLKPDGRMILPLGNSFSGQDLVVLKKNKSGLWDSKSVLPVMFVPFKRKH